MRKVMVTAGLTGGVHGKEANPNLPEQPQEIISQAVECREAGASIVHVHARDKNGKPTMDLGIFREIHDGIRKSTDLIVELTTGGGPKLTMEERIGSLSLKPEMSSLNTFMIIIRDGNEEMPLIFPRSEIEHHARRAREMGVKPDMAVLNFASLEEIENLIEKGLVDKPYVLTIGLDMSAQGVLRGTPKNLLALVERLPEDAIFTVTAAGEAQLSLTTMSMLLGGHARVGLEDSVTYAPGRLATGNAELVARTARIARELNLEVATPDEARDILQIG
jgi:3-keto-5-aminohexanoate cleavage enzyme